MPSPARLLRRVVHLFGRDRFERELAEELEFHREQKVSAKLAAGVDLSLARREAARELGNLTRAREDSRAAWGWDGLDGVVRDVRFAARWLRLHPAFTITATLTLALGIGANTALWSVARPVLFERLPVRDPDRLVVVHGGTTAGTRTETLGSRDVRIFSVPMFERLRVEATGPESALLDLAAASSFTGAVYWRRDDAPIPERLEALLVSGNYFEVLGATAGAGRLIEPSDDETPGGHALVVSSWELATRALGADPRGRGEDVIGRELRLGDRSYTVIGVTPPGFRGEMVDRRVDLWVPLAMEAELMAWPSRRTAPEVLWLRLIGRLRPGRTAAAAAGELTERFGIAVRDEAGGELSGEAAANLERQRLEVAPLARGLSRVRVELSRSLGLLGVVVAVLLLVACANVANLLLARARAREREMAARLALGAPRRRLVRQLLIESVLLAAAGGAAGLLAATWGGRALLQLLAHDSPLASDLELDWRLLLFCAFVSLVTVLLFGLVPALRATRLHLVPALRDATTLGARRAPLGGRGLVAVQAGLSLALLVGAGLFLRSLANLELASPGVRVDGVMVASLDPRGGGYETNDESGAERLAALYERLGAALEAEPAIVRHGFSRYSLYSGSGSRTSLYGDPDDRLSGDGRFVRYLAVTDGYFDTVGIEIQRGRGFDTSDRLDSPPVAVVTRALALAVFGEVEVVGRRVGYSPESRSEVEIIGVAQDFAIDDLRDEPLPIFFLPASQDQGALHSLAVRLRNAEDPGGIAVVRRTLRQAAPELPVTEVRPLRELLRETYRQQRSVAILLGSFAALALLLTAVGLYGVLAFSVDRRMRELGIRLAIGADRGRIVRLVFVDAAKLVAVGLVCGGAVSLLACRWVSSFLYRLAPTDPMSIGAACVVFVAVAAVAAWLPARRAARLQPLTVLRHD